MVNHVQVGMDGIMAKASVNAQRLIVVMKTVAANTIVLTQVNVKNVAN